VDFDARGVGICTKLERLLDLILESVSCTVRHFSSTSNIWPSTVPALPKLCVTFASTQ